jgi:hypothetical protein
VNLPKRNLKVDTCSGGHSDEAQTLTLQFSAKSRKASLELDWREQPGADPDDTRDAQCFAAIAGGQSASPSTAGNRRGWREDSCAAAAFARG